MCTKTEFGMTLYKTIALLSGREQARKLYKVYQLKLEWPAEKRKRLMGMMKKQEKDLTEEIVQLMPLLDAIDQCKLLDRYESQGAA